MAEIKFGKIEYALANVGTKSEAVQPFVVEADGTRTQVFLEGDNPFENKGLRDFEGREVAVSGGKRNGSTIFTVQAIKENPLDEREVTSSESETPTDENEVQENEQGENDKKSG